MEKFSEFADETPTLDGKKVKLQDIINQQIVVKDFRVFKSKVTQGECLQLQIEIDGESKVVFTGSLVLIKQIRKYQQHLPFQTTIKQVSKYFLFT